MATIGNDITYAISLLQQGKAVAIPTETVYGLAADASSVTAIEIVFKLKNRPKNRTLSLNIHPNWDILQWVQSPAIYVETLINQFWPGPLTIVLQAKENTVLPELIGPNHSLALRCPNHPMTLQLLKSYGKPLVAPSANPSDNLSPCSAEAVYSFFRDTELYILDGQASEIGLESTILLAHDDSNYEILRQGAISAEAIEACIGFKASKINQSIKTSVKTNRYYFKNIDELAAIIKEDPILIASEETIALFPMLESHILSIKNFYTLLALIDTQPKRLILIECHPKDLMALQDRIKKFCHPLSAYSIPTL